MGSPRVGNDRRDVRLVRRLVLGEARVAVDAIHRHLRARDELGRERAEIDRQPLHDRGHRLADVRLVVVAVGVEPLAPIVALERAQKPEGFCREVHACAGVRAVLRHHRRHPLLHLAGEVRHLADHPLHRHQLRAVVHLVLLGAEQHLEPALRRRLRARRHRHLLGEERFGQALEERGELVALGLQERDDLRLGARLRFLGRERSASARGS